MNSIAFSPDGIRIASASNDGTVKLWESATGREVFTLRGHTSGVISLAFSPDGQHLATGSAGRDGPDLGCPPCHGAAPMGLIEPIMTDRSRRTAPTIQATSAGPDPVPGSTSRRPVPRARGPRCEPTRDALT